MPKKIEIKPIREWQEKDGRKILNSIRLYIGNMHIATVTPDRIYKDEYYCHLMIQGVINVESKRQPLQIIKDQIELSIKEFISKTLNNFEK
jgi:hypothetical protein